jgi:hypothetical protein
MPAPRAPAGFSGALSAVHGLDAFAVPSGLLRASRSLEDQHVSMLRMGAHIAREVEGEGITWQVAHAALSRLARERAAADAEEGRWLLAARRAAAHAQLGFGSFSEYVERLFGYQPRSTQEKLRVAEALEGLPAFERALREGELSWSHVRELTRVAVDETERDWLELARGKTVRQLKALLAGKRLGDEPSAPPDLADQRHVLRFEVTGETFALFRDALKELRRRHGGAPDDDSALLEMARGVLGGPLEEGRASYQVVLSVCPACSGGRQHADGALVPIGPDVVAMAHCDGQHLGLISEPRPAAAEDASRDGGLRQEPHAEHARPAEQQGRTEKPCTAANDNAPMAAPASLQERRAIREPTSIRRSAHAGARAKQSIPPSLRRAVLLRDERCCQVPGCRRTRFLDLHHVELRSEGGQHSADNLVCLCGAHHRAVHRGQLLLERSSVGALRVRHADGSEYGSVTAPQALQTHAKVFSALRNLGFREGEVRAAFRQLETESALGEPTFDRLLRAALAQLRPAEGARRSH